MNMNTIEKVGVLLVHGIGEQRRFEHLTDEIRHLVSAWETLPGVRRVSVAINASRDAQYLADSELWKADDAAPVRVDVDFNGRPVEIHVHEVWWADLDEPVTLRSQLAFWCWGLYQWAARPFDKTMLTGLLKHMRLPKLQSGRSRSALLSWERAQLFAVGTIFLLTLFSLELANFVLRRFLIGRIPGSDILVRYLGDVKLFQQRGRIGSGPLGDMNQPPRVAIRRRMVRAMADVALQDYDRSFILAHSLGTVVAWNGLMESAHCLPNFLDQARWDRCLAKGIGEVAQPGSPLLGPTHEMRPSRPGWLDDDHVIDRKKLFGKLQGFLTYGSPLDKFAFLWPNIVPINKDNEAVFPPGFQWINVYDNTDPVGASLEAFEPHTSSDDTHSVASPKNFSFDASPWLLISHLKYLDFTPGKTGQLVNRLAEWLVSGQRFREPTPGEAGWLTLDQEKSRAASRLVQWGVASIVLAGLVAWWVEPSVGAIWQSFFGADQEAVSYLCTSSQTDGNPVTCLTPVATADTGTDSGTLARVLFGIPLYIGLAACIVGVVGCVGRWLEDRKARTESTGSASPE